MRRKTVKAFIIIAFLFLLVVSIILGFVFIPALTFGFFIPICCIMLIRLIQPPNKKRNYVAYFSLLAVAAVFSAIYFPIIFSRDIESKSFNLNYHPGISRHFVFKSEGGKVHILRYVGNSESVVIPSTINGKEVTRIAKGIFSGREEIESLTLPFLGENSTHDGKTHLGWLFSKEDVFSNSAVPNGLTSLVILDGYIGARAFEDCSSLNEISTPNGVKHIGESAFQNTGWLNNKPDGLVYFSNFLVGFKGEMPANYELTNILASTTHIVSKAFFNQRSLVRAIIPDSVISIGAGAFSSSGIVYARLSSNLLAIESSTFAFCTKLNDIIVPNKVTTIGGSAFLNCRSLEKINLNNVKDIEANAFANCIKLTQITLNNVRTVGDRAFYECNALTSIELSRLLEYLGEAVFANCFELTTIIVSSMDKIDLWHSNWAHRCLASITVKGDN